MEAPTKIDEKTLVPISLLIIIIGGVYWLSSLGFRVSASEKTIEIQTKEIEAIHRIEKKLSRIEGHMGIKEDSNDTN